MIETLPAEIDSFVRAIRSFGFLRKVIWVLNTVQRQDTFYLGPQRRPKSWHIIRLAQVYTMKCGPESILPQSLAPRGLSREQAAAYVGISPSLFDMLVKDGRMPSPKRINARTVWDRLQLDAASLPARQ